MPKCGRVGFTPRQRAEGVKLHTGAPSASHQGRDRWSSVQANFLLLWLCLLSPLAGEAEKKEGHEKEKRKNADFFLTLLGCLFNGHRGQDVGVVVQTAPTETKAYRVRAGHTKKKQRKITRKAKRWPVSLVFQFKLLLHKSNSSSSFQKGIYQSFSLTFCCFASCWTIEKDWDPETVVWRPRATSRTTTRVSVLQTVTCLEKWAVAQQHLLI